MLRFDPSPEDLRYLCANAKLGDRAEAHVHRLIEAMARASLAHYEGKPALTTVALRATPVSEQIFAEASSIELAFKSPMELTEKLLRDLAPVLGARSALLVRIENERLEAWGVGNQVGPLRLQAVCPGRVEVYTTTRTGIFDWERSEVFENLSDLFAKEIERCASFEDSRKFQDWPEALRALLARVRSLQRGGTVLLAPSDLDLTVSLSTRQFELAFPSAMFANAADATFYEGRALRSLAKHEFYAEEAGRATESGLVHEYYSTKASADAARELGIEQTARLTAIDGALVLNYSLGIVAIGAKILCSRDPSSLDEVDFVTGDRRPTSLKDCGGMRHQSAIRFVNEVNGSVAFVCSQDGGVSLVHRDQQDTVVITRRVELALQL